jgi:hypothetical protein
LRPGSCNKPTDQSAEHEDLFTPGRYSNEMIELRRTIRRVMLEARETVRAF